MSDEWTQVRLRKETCRRLKLLGGMGDSYETVINRLIDENKMDSK